MQDLNISIVQANVHWENKADNLSLFDRLLTKIPDQTDLIVLPELFSTGFTMNAKELCEPMDGPTMEWMVQKAEELKAVITGSLIIEEEDHYFNRLVWIDPNNELLTYDKRHLFRMGNEHKTYTSGDQRLITTLNEWRICPQICYDLRFPVWNRNDDNYDCLIIVANWPDIRSKAWKILLQARAVENISYVVGVNRVGNDGNGVYHSGYSSIIDHEGAILYESKDNEEVHSIKLSKTALHDFREKFPAQKDADNFTIGN